MTSGRSEADALPRLIQGGMGVAVSGWRLARAVSLEGQLGVVSGTALDVVLVRRLQLGDVGGHVRRALAAFPVAGVADSIVSELVERGFRGRMRTVRSADVYIPLGAAANVVLLSEDDIVRGAEEVVR